MSCTIYTEYIVAYTVMCEDGQKFLNNIYFWETPISLQDGALVFTPLFVKVWQWLHFHMVLRHYPPDSRWVTPVVWKPRGRGTNHCHVSFYCCYQSVALTDLQSLYTTITVKAIKAVQKLKQIDGNHVLMWIKTSETRNIEITHQEITSRNS